MFSRQKNWISGGLWRPKNPHSLEHLKYLYGILGKSQTVTESNKSLLVETLRSISEILIWGDQNDSSVFDFFLEKNMLAFFLRFMRQKSGRHICVQLLQTLNILFENIDNETSVYYLLSNNHINSIIVHKFDFSDEEVMAYYISFLKTLSLKLNKHTIHFFYNEHTNDFALYTEAIKFFNHSESMVRIAVRTITLNVFKACKFCIHYDTLGLPQVEDKSMLRYIRDRTAAPYFSNLVWFIGNHILELDSCVRNDADHNSRDRLADLVAEHLDHLHYLNDILNLNIDALNDVLTDHLLNRLLIPLYVYSLTKRNKYAPQNDERPHISSAVSVFLLSQVFLILSHAPLVRQLADIIFNGNLSVCMDSASTIEALASNGNGSGRLCGFVAPREPLAQTLESNKATSTTPGRKHKKKRSKQANSAVPGMASASTDSSQHLAPKETGESLSATSSANVSAARPIASSASPEHHSSAEAENIPVNTELSTEAEAFGSTELSSSGHPQHSIEAMSRININSTDEEKLLICGATLGQRQSEFSLVNRPYLDAIFTSLDCVENDYDALFALCFLYALGHNEGINQELLDSVLMPTDKSKTKDHYNIALVEKLIKIISRSCQSNSRIRLATLEMSILLLEQLVYQNHTGGSVRESRNEDATCYLQDRHLAALEGAKEEATLLLRNFYKSEEIFLDMFEDEFREMTKRPLNVEYLMMDASILLSPTGTPLTGIEFSKRLPCGEVERARRAIRVFFMLRTLSLALRQEPDDQLPLTKEEECIKDKDVLDLNNSDLIACTVISRDSKRERRFLVIDILQLILVEPDSKRLGWGVVKFVGFLQDVEVTGDKDDSRSLHITIHKPTMNVHARPLPLLSARFIFDDHIRCMAAKQRLSKGRLRARQRKMQMIARLLELPSNIVESMYQPSLSSQSTSSVRSAASSAIPGRSHVIRTHRSEHAQQRAQSEIVQRSVFASVNQVPGFGVAKEKKSPVQSSATSRQLSQPIGVRQKSRPSGNHGVIQSKEASDKKHESSSFVNGEEDQESRETSPEAHALQSLNPGCSPVREPRSGLSSRNSSTDNLQDIPLEDLSKKKNISDRKAGIGLHARIRSSSYSPARSLGSDSSGKQSPVSQSMERSRSSSRSRSHVQRAGSFPSPRPSRGKTANVEQTSFTVRNIRSNSESLPSPASDLDSLVVDAFAARQRRDSLGPKTLTPAAEPTASLLPPVSIPASYVAPSVESPKLLPPAESVRLRSGSGTSSLASSDYNSTSLDNHIENTEFGTLAKQVQEQLNPSQEPAK